VDAPGGTLRAPVSVRLDPHNNATPAQLQAQYDALMSLAGVQSQVQGDIAQLERMQRDAVKERRTRLRVSIDEALARLRNPEPSGYRQPARLSEQIAYLRNILEQYDGPPTEPQRALMRQFQEQAAAAGAEVASLRNDMREPQTERR
jgi:hypothetical protein